MTKPASSKRPAQTIMNHYDLQDLILRALIVVAGGLAAVLFFLRGQGQALPALALGGTIGAWAMTRFGPDAE
jgi:hypothetical protein